MKPWQEQTILITGSSRGLGRVLAQELLNRGARVILNGRDPVRLENTRSELARLCQREGQLGAFAADVGRRDGARGLADYVERNFGALTGLVNNAGVSMRGAFQDLSEETAEAVIRSNIQGALYPTLEARRLLTGGRVVFVSSLAALRGFPGVGIYSAAKMALTALVQGLRTEWKPLGISVGQVLLGFVENDPDKTILTAQGAAVKHQRKAQLTQVQAAQALIRGLQSRRERVLTTFGGRVLDKFQRWWPGVVDWLVDRSAGKLHRVQVQKP